MSVVYLLIGSNEGNRQEQLQKAILLLNQKAGKITGKSSIYETDSWGIEDLPDHYNQALCLETEKTPFELLDLIHKIENELGRKRQEKWGLRSIDIDIIYFDNLVLNEDQLIIPHPLLQKRNFALAPLAELAPHFLHPLLKKPNIELFYLSQDRLKVKALL